MKVWIVTDHGNQILGVFDNEDSLKWFMNGQEKDINWGITEYEVNSNKLRLNKIYDVWVDVLEKKIELIKEPFYVASMENSITEYSQFNSVFHIRVVANSEEEVKKKVEKYIKQKWKNVNEY